MLKFVENSMANRQSSVSRQFVDWISSFLYGAFQLWRICCDYSTETTAT